tara:strand:+ start:1131 stop:1448 length:318 start_codon:yes stop_codon:yes gene_type:complete
LIEIIFSALFGFVCLCLLILKERERTKDKERHFSMEKELLDRIMSRDYGEYSAAKNFNSDDRMDVDNFTQSENETSIYLQALGEELPPNLASEFEIMTKGDVDGR